MIIIENILKMAFDTLPNLGMTEETPLGFKPYYDWGNEEHLRKTHLLKKEDLYPLIYQTSNSERQNYKRQEIETDLTLILAVQNHNTDELNKERWNGSTYSDILFPLVNNIEQLFTKGVNIFTWDGSSRITKIPNYGKDTAGNNATPIDIWDVVLLEILGLKIKNNCLNNIIYANTN